MIRTGLARSLFLIILLGAVAAVVIHNDRGASDYFNRNMVESLEHRWCPLVRTVARPTLRVGSDFEAALIVITAGLGLAALRMPFRLSGKRWPGRGTAAIAASALGVGYGIARVAIDTLMDSTSGFLGLLNPRFLFDSVRFCAGFPKGTVLGAWSLLFLAGRWKSPADGLEWLGRGLGWSWIALIAFDLFRSALC